LTPLIVHCVFIDATEPQVVPFGDGENNQSGTIGKSFWRKNKKVADGMAQKNPVRAWVFVCMVHHNIFVYGWFYIAVP
jgi:hypothetical protein